MAGIKIHNYPIERTSFGDDDYYDIDYWTGTAYETAKIKGSVLKSALGYSFVDIEAFISGYTLSANDAGKVITNGGNPFRDLLINTSLNAPGHTFHIKGRVVVSPQFGVNIDLPDGSTITEPAQYTCEADTHYVLHRKAYTGTNWVLSAINKDTLTNLGLSDLEQMDLVRVFEVFEDGELKFITNHANSDAIFRVGENSEERFGEIDLNSETFNQTVAVQSPTNDGQGIITSVNPNEFDVDSRDDITDVGTRRNRIYFNPQQTLLEHSEYGRLVFRQISLDGENIFEDLSPTKKGLQYNADYSADYTDRSLVDKAFVLNNASNIGNSNLSIPSATTRTLTIPSDSILDLGANLRVRNNILELQSVTRGFLMNRVTTIQMNAIVGMSDNELVFNTDVKAIYRYDATLLQWVALSSGYGIIAVYSGSGSGVPTFFATLQSALETCKASGGYFTVKLYSNLTITSAIEIDYTGSGTGKAYQFRQLTIDFNGFSVTNAQANTTDAFTLQLSNSASVYQEIRLINGNIIRTNGTGTHRALKCDQTARFGTIQMEKMLIFCQNSTAASIDLFASTQIGASNVCDLGGSFFYSISGTALNLGSSGQKTRNFNAKSDGSATTLILINGDCSDFNVENTSIGVGLSGNYTTSNRRVKNFYVKTNSGNGVVNANPSNIVYSNFEVVSTSGICILSTSQCNFSHFYVETGDARAIQVQNNADLSFGKAINNSGTRDTIELFNFQSINFVEAINLGARRGLISYNSSGRAKITNCRFESVGFSGAFIQSDGSSAKVKVNNCQFASYLNTSNGHALVIGQLGSSTIDLTNSYLEVTNASANCIIGNGAVNLRVGFNIHNQVATTPVNANVTLVAMGF